MFIWRIEPIAIVERYSGMWGQRQRVLRLVYVLIYIEKDTIIQDFRMIYSIISTNIFKLLYFFILGKIVYYNRILLLNQKILLNPFTTCPLSLYPFIYLSSIILHYIISILIIFILSICKSYRCFIQVILFIFILVKRSIKIALKTIGSVEIIRHAQLISIWIDTII